MAHEICLLICSLSKKSTPVALLVFLAAAARAGVVATYFRASANGLGFGLRFRRRRSFAHDVAGFALRASCGRAATERAGGLVQGLLRDVFQEIFKCHYAGRAAENVVTDFRFHVDHEFIENLERLGLYSSSGSRWPCARRPML